MAGDSFSVLVVTALSLGTLHTAIGVDHFAPFVVLARTRGWSCQKTLLITLICGLGHIASSILLAAVGLGLGVAGARLQWVDQTRGAWAAWMLVGFGVAYAGAALWKHHRQMSHPSHDQQLLDGAPFSNSPRLTAALFLLFVVGPCEALLPLLTAGGIVLSFYQAAVVAGVFALATLFTMLAMVALGYLGWGIIGRPLFGGATSSHLAHTLAGLTLALSGLSIRVLGL